MKINFEDYIKDVKSQLDCCLTENNSPAFIIYSYTQEEIDSNLEYFKQCRNNGLSAYKALLFFDCYLDGENIFN